MSINEIRRFLYIGPTIDLCDLKTSKEVLLNIDAIITALINDKKGNDIIKEVMEYFKAYNQYFLNKQTQTYLECIAYVLASCSTAHGDEKFSHSGFN